MKIRNLTFVLTTALFISGSLLSPVFAQSDATFGLGRTAGAAGLKEIGGGDVPTLVGNVIGTALSMIGVLFFILMVYGGFLWMTARGNEEQTKKAFNTITAAVVGIIIVMASYAITTFVFHSVQSTPAGGVTGSCLSPGGPVAACATITDPTTCNATTGCAWSSG